MNLTSSRPRDVELTPSGLALLGAGIALIVGGIVLGVFLYRLSVTEHQRSQFLNANGATTVANVTRLWRGGDDSQTRRAGYVFQVGGEVYTSQSKIRSPQWKTLTPGSSLMIRYLPSDPNQNVVIGSEPNVLPFWAPVFIGSAMAVLGVFCLTLLQMQRNLLTNGRLATGVVTDIVKRRTSHGGTHRSMNYEFRLLSGALASGKSNTSSKGPPVGSTINVIYDPDRPKRSMGYPLALVRIRK